MKWAHQATGEHIVSSLLADIRDIVNHFSLKLLAQKLRAETTILIAFAPGQELTVCAAYLIS